MHFPAIEGRQQVYIDGMVPLYCQLPSDSCKSVMSSIYMMNRSGPSTELCGTPDDTGKMSHLHRHTDFLRM